MEPPPPFAQVMDDLIKGQEFATQLQGLLRDSPKAGLIMDQILHTFSRAIHAAKAAAATSASERSSDVQSEVTDGASGGGKRKSASAAAGGNRKGACRRRTQQSSVVTKSMKSLDDGQAWRKYGQKEIQNSKHSRAYFRCTHKYDQMCTAQRQVQRCDDDEDMFRVTYIGVHTCRDPAAAVAPHVLHLTGTAEDLHAGCHLISFAPGSATGATHGAATSTTTTATLNANLVDKDAAMGSGLKPESGDQEEVLSSRTPGSSALHSTAAAATTPTWPDQGDVTSTLQYGGAGNFGELFDDYASLGDLVSYVLDH